jgi:hypothetical protein
VHAANHALPREFIGARQQCFLALGDHGGEQQGHDVTVGGVAARIRKISLHVADAGPHARFDLVGTQAPEAILRRAHVRSHVIFCAPGEPAQGG